MPKEQSRRPRQYGSSLSEGFPNHLCPKACFHTDSGV